MFSINHSFSSVLLLHSDLLKYRCFQLVNE